MYPVELSGQLVRLRELAASDAVAVQRWVGDPDTVRHVPLGPLDAAGTRRYLAAVTAEARARPRRSFTLGIVESASGELVGAATLGVDSEAHRRAELGYMLRADARGRGLATEAVSLLLELAFERLGMMRVWAVCDPDNDRSIRLLRRVGMVEEGRLRSDLCIRGEWRDSLLFAMLATDRPQTYL